MGIISAAYNTGRYVLQRSSDGGELSLDSSSSLHNAPSWLLVSLAFACLVMAAAASGMTLGYMSLDTVGLEIIAQSGRSAEASAARAILPVREQGNLLLVTLLLTNTIATELLPLVLEALHPGGYFSLVTSVVSLILFGEIIPQAVCSRHALEIGASMINLVKALRFAIYPIAAPIAFLLDKCLGQELGTIYNRDELKGLIDVHSRSKYGVLTDDETTILKGTLEFSQKTVSDVLTPAEDVFMLDVETTLDRAVLLEMLRRGHSRIPLYEGDRNNVVCLLLLKQLILVDPSDSLPIRAIISKKKRAHKIRVSPALHCSKDALLSDVLNEFQRGRSHMAIVYDDITNSDSEREMIGIVTIEDIIEEILQEEIIDETDVVVSNVSKEPVYSRGPDGKLQRSRTKTAPYLIAPARMPGTKTIVLKEIDVDSLKQPLVATFLTDTDKSGKRKILSIPRDDITENRKPTKRKAKPSIRLSTVDLALDRSPQHSGDSGQSSRPQDASREPTRDVCVDIDADDPDSSDASLQCPSPTLGRPGSHMAAHSSVKRRASVGERILSQMTQPDSESSALLPGNAPGPEKSNYGAAHSSLDISSFPEIPVESEDEREGWGPADSNPSLSAKKQ